MNPSIANPSVYQADQAMLQSIHHCREHVQGVCKQHMHKCVRIQTLAGEMFEGAIVGVDDHYVYVDVAQGPMGMRAFQSPYYSSPFIQPYNPYAATVLPLVLFNLLAISLI